MKTVLFCASSRVHHVARTSWLSNPSITRQPVQTTCVLFVNGIITTNRNTRAKPANTQHAHMKTVSVSRPVMDGDDFIMTVEKLIKGLPTSDLKIAGIGNPQSSTLPAELLKDDEIYQNLYSQLVRL